jgi:hypothetical protein
VQSNKAICQWTLKIFEVVLKPKHKFQVKKGHNSVKMLERVVSSCLHVWGMMVKKCAHKQSHMSMDFENTGDGSQT